MTTIECDGAPDEEIYRHHNWPSLTELVVQSQAEAVFGVRGAKERAVWMKVSRRRVGRMAHCKDVARCNAVHIGATNYHKARRTFALLRLGRQATIGIRSIFPAMQM